MSDQHLIQVPGISCNHCKQSIEQALQKTGVQATVDVATKTVAVQLTPSTTLPQIIETIEAQGYDVKR